MSGDSILCNDPLPALLLEARQFTVTFLYFRDVTTRRILIAEDDADDQLLLKTAFIENGGQQILDFVEDGVAVMCYLNSIDLKKKESRYPDFIVLDLNMPKKNGKEVLCEIKNHPVFKMIPVIIYTTTRDEQEVKRCYELGANTYIVKPSNFERIVKVVKTMLRYWLSTAIIPPLNPDSKL